MRLDRFHEKIESKANAKRESQCKRQCLNVIVERMEQRRNVNA